MDIQVRLAQAWLNTTFGSVSGWVRLDEDGVTGWATMYGLRRALQIELGITSLSTAFGPTTVERFVSRIGAFDSGTTNARQLGILSAALWCKGYAGLFDPATGRFSDLVDSVRELRQDLGLDPAPALLDVKLVASLMSMDAYVKVVLGSTAVRAIQQWLNRTYLSRADFAVVPCDGVYSRQTQKSLLFAVQYECEMKDGVANGNFGDGTKRGIRTHATVLPGDRDAEEHGFVHLLQAALTFNEFPTEFDGVHGASSQAALRDFQRFMELPENGTGDYGSWCALLVASGDTERATRGCDTRTQLTRSDLQRFRADGYEVVGRYLVGSDKFISPDEIVAFHDEDMRLVPIHQRFNDDVTYMTAANGALHAREAVTRARLLGLPDQTTIYFTVDFDALDDAMSAIRRYFQAIKDYMNTLRTVRYKIGVYATRNVCSTMLAFEVADDAYVSGMSNGYSGNMGFRLPRGWAYNQIVETTTAGGSGRVGIDRVVVSRAAAPVRVGAIDPPGREHDGTPTATGFDDLLRWVSEVEVEIETTNTIVSLPSPGLGLTVPNALRRLSYTSPGWRAYLSFAPPESRAQAAADAVVARVGRPPSPRDTPHLAATYMGYLAYGVPQRPDTYTYGDLGGWTLDLLQLFGSWVPSAGDISLGDFFSQHLGVVGDDQGFSYGDLLADADGYLCGSRPAGELWSQNIRAGIGTSTPAQRVRRFASLRVGSSADVTADVLSQMFDGLDAWGVNLGFTTGSLLQMADSPRMPSRAEIETMSSVFVSRLAELS